MPLIAPGVCYGALDVAADSLATEASAADLARELSPNVAVWVSPLRRCQQLADALHCVRPDLRFRTDVRLSEMNFGSWEGVAWSDIPKDAVDAWTQAFGTHQFGGQESANAVLARVALAWDEAHSTVLPHRNLAWITHAGVIRAATLLRDGVRQVEHAQQWPAKAPAFGQWASVA